MLYQLPFLVVHMLAAAGVLANSVWEAALPPLTVISLSVTSALLAICQLGRTMRSDVIANLSTRTGREVSAGGQVPPADPRPAQTITIHGGQVIINAETVHWSKAEASHGSGVAREERRAA
ncbi:hypothetical protein [Ideonella livida]|uniref:Uncharacterized protein n=1 Tax=Ideonella livida TaxID=2707176 RepID=A0A7C9THU7_9BURK|nr:hypothetical protein [Ideonella livida]NDY89763.1 hypothetical protein [Ideonella livida]